MHAQRLRITPLRSIVGTLGLLLLAAACEDDELRVIDPLMATGSQQPGMGDSSPSGSGGSSDGMEPSASAGSGDTPNMGGSSSVAMPNVQPPGNEGPEVE